MIKRMQFAFRVGTPPGSFQPQVQLEAYNDMPLLKAIFGEEEDEG
jgi:hypothetical protein